MQAGALAAGAALAAATAAGAALLPVRVTFEGVAGARPGMTPAAVSTLWAIRVRPSYELRPGCGEAVLRGWDGVTGTAIFMPRDRFGAVFFREGATTARGIAIGSSVAAVRRAYPGMTSRSSRFHHGGREWVARRATAPRWELRFDVDRSGRVTQIAFGTQAAVRLDEGCA